MSQTVIPDHRDRMLQLENVSNRLVHHCRIVNVDWKAVRAKIAQSELVQNLHEFDVYKACRIGKIQIKVGQTLVCDQPCGNFY